MRPDEIADAQHDLEVEKECFICHRHFRGNHILLGEYCPECEEMIARED